MSSTIVMQVEHGNDNMLVDFYHADWIIRKKICFFCFYLNILNHLEHDVSREIKWERESCLNKRSVFPFLLLFVCLIHLRSLQMICRAKLAQSQGVSAIIFIIDDLIIAIAVMWIVSMMLLKKRLLHQSH